MPIFSYLAIPVKGEKDTLCRELSTRKYCQIIPAENQEVIVLVTDTPDEIQEKKLQQTLQHIESMQSLSLAFGYSENE